MCRVVPQKPSLFPGATARNGPSTSRGVTSENGLSGSTTRHPRAGGDPVAAAPELNITVSGILEHPLSLSAGDDSCGCVDRQLAVRSHRITRHSLRNAQALAAENP